MNPEAIKLAYELFQKEGYNGSQEDFISLINSDSKALNLAHDLFTEEGYNQGLDNFSSLMGVGKKKEEELLSTTPEEGVDLSTQENQEEFLSGALYPIKSDDGVIPIEPMLAGLPRPEDYETVSELLEREEAERQKKRIEREEKLEEERERFAEQAKAEIDEEKLAELDIKLPPATRAEAEEQMAEEAAAWTMQREALAEKKKEEFEQEYLSKVEREKEKTALQADEQFIQDVGQDFTEYFGMETDSAVRSLQNKYGKYGIIFKKHDRAFGGSIKATAFNGEEYIMPLNEYTTAGRTMPQDLKAFIEENARTPKDKLTKIEEEGIEFFSNRGVDYITYKDMQDRYAANLELIKFLSYQTPFQEPESVKTGDLPYKDMYVDGVLRADYKDFLKKAVEDNIAIRNYLYSKDMEETRVGWNLELQAKTEKTSEIAQEYNAVYNGMMAALNEETQKLFGIDADKLADYKPTNELDQRRKDYLLDYYAQTKEQRKLAKDSYALAMSYFDEKDYKELAGELVEGGAAFRNSLKQGLENGRAAQTLLSIAMGLTDLSDEDTMDETVEKIMRHLDNADTGKFSVGDITYHNAKNTWELLRAVRNRPLELIAAFTGQSIAQMLPIGSRLIPTAVAAGAGTGALGFTPVTVLGGALTGLNAGLASTNVAIEYTNSLLDAARERYDITKPEEFEKALQDEEVWAQARNIGLKRGLTIGAVDFLGGKFAGKMIPVSRLATPAARIATQGIERLIIDPAMEMFGEAMAQGVAGQQLKFSEILAEGLGSIGGKAPMALANQMFSNEKNTVAAIVKDLSDIDSFMDDNSLDSRVLSWTDRQENMGRIDSNQAQQIRDNISIRSEAREILNVAEDNRQKPSNNPEAEKRLANLLKAKRKLTSTETTQEAFSEQISAINKEIKEIARTGDVVAVEQQADISMLEAAPTEVAPTEQVTAETTSDEKRANIETQRQDALNSIGQRQIQKLFKDLKDAVSESQIAQTIINIQKNIKEGAKITKEEQDFLNQKTQELEDKGFEIIDYTGEVYNQGMTLEILSFKPLEEGENLSQEEINALEKEIENRKKKRKRLKEKGLSEEQIDSQFDDTISIMTTVQPQVNKDGKLVQGAKVNALQIEVSKAEEVLERSKKNPKDTKKERIKKINDKFDAELAALEETTQAAPTEVAPIETDEKNIGEVNPTQTYSFRFEEGNVPPEFQGLTPTGIIEATQGLFKRKKFVTLMFKGQQLIDAGIATQAAPTAMAAMTEEGVVQDTEQVAAIEKVEAEERKLTPEDEAYIQQQVEDMKALFDEDDGVQFMLETEKTDSDKMQKLVESATKLMDEVSPELESNAYEVQDTEQPTVPVEITENKELADKVGRTSVKDLVGKFVNYVMADFLKVDKNKMGGPLFGLQKGIFENGIAWASVSRDAAMEIIRGAAKGDLSVVYRMDDGGIDSNLAMFDEFAKILNSLKDKVNLQEAWNDMSESIKSINFKKKNDFVSRLVDTSTSFEDFVKKIRETDTNKERLSLGDRAKIIRKLLPEQNKKPKEKLKKDLKDNGVTIEQLRSNLSEQMAEGAPVGSFLATFEVQDKNGNKVTEDTLEEAIMTREEAEAAGIPLHENYPIYIRGQYKSLMSDTLPAWYTNKKLREVIDKKIAGIEKEKTGRRFTSKEAEGAAVYTMQLKSSTAFEVTTPVEKQYTTFVKRLSKAFPNVVVAATKEQFDALRADLNAKSLITKNQNVYGAVYEGKLYLNPELENYNTPIHEFGHVWLNAAKQLNPEVYKRGLELIKNSEYVTTIEKSKSYQKVVQQMRKDGATEAEITNYLLEEALATAIGDKGESFVSAAQKKNFKNWMNELFAFIKKLTGISNITPEQLQDLTLDKFLEGVVVDLLSENEQFKEAEVKTLSNQLQLMTSPPNLSIDDMVRIGRSNGIKDDAIKIYLKDKGFSSTDINNALSVQISSLQVMPKEFGNVEGGMNEGMKLFNQVRKKLSDFAKQEDRSSLIREKALDILKENPIFKKQDRGIQLELTLALDRSLGIRSNPRVRQEIAEIRKRLAEIKKDKNFTEKAKRQVRAFIRKNLPVSRHYNKSKINKLIKQVSMATPTNIEGIFENIKSIIEDVRQKMKVDVINEIAKIAKQKAKIQRTTSGKRRNKGVDAIGQSYFSALNQVLNAVKKNDIDALQKMQDNIDNSGVDMQDVIERASNNEPITPKERTLLDKQLALDGFSDIVNLELEEVQEILKEVKAVRAESIARLNNRRQYKRAEVDGLQKKAQRQIRDDYKSFYDEQGNPYDREQIEARKNAVRNELKANGVFPALKVFLNQLGTKIDYSPNEMASFFRNNMYHLKTILNIIDRGKEGFFTKYFWDNLSDADENTLRGVEDKTDVLDSIVNGVNKKNKKWSKWKYTLGEKVIKIDGIVNMKTGAKVSDAINKDQAMRIYALSLNDVQKNKLNKRGFTDEKIEKIKEFIGEDNVKIVDAVVSYLTNTYFDEINAVFEQLNDVSLGFVENYFPTSTLSDISVDADLISTGNFSKVFDAENSPFTKDRTDTEGIIEYSLPFTEILEEYIKVMERYKNYAPMVRQMNEVLKDSEIKTVLEQTGTEGLFRQNLNYAINPNARASNYTSREIHHSVYNIAAGLALGLKPAQIYRQAMSFIQAFDEYKFLPNRRTPALDLIGFILDMGIVMATFPLQVLDFMKVSATFKNRIRMGLRGDIAGLEGNLRNYKPLSSKKNFGGRLLRATERLRGLYTVLGDLTGVLGYKAVYNRMIRNGVPKATALRIANRYNETQQSRRAMEMTPLQQDPRSLMKMITMFASTSILQLNNVAQSLRSLLTDAGRFAKTGKRSDLPKLKDIRKLALNYALANMLWTASSYVFALTKGSDEDRDRALRAIKDSALGLTILERIPLLGFAITTLKNTLNGEPTFQSAGVNPYLIIFKNFEKEYKKVQETGEDLRMLIPIFETLVGMQFDSPIGIYNMLDGDISMEDMMDFLGVAPSYRPGYGSGKGLSYKTIMKEKLGEELFERLYGKKSSDNRGKSSREEVEGRLKERDKRTGRRQSRN